MCYDRIQGYSTEQEFCMTRLDWGLDYTQSVWNVRRTGKNCCSEWKQCWKKTIYK